MGRSVAKEIVGRGTSPKQIQQKQRFCSASFFFSRCPCLICFRLLLFHSFGCSFAPPLPSLRAQGLAAGGGSLTIVNICKRTNKFKKCCSTHGKQKLTGSPFHIPLSLWIPRGLVLVPSLLSKKLVIATVSCGNLSAVQKKKGCK